LSQSLVPPEPRRFGGDFSIGICAADRATNLKELLTLIESEPYPKGFVLTKVIIVASGCDPQTILPIRELVKQRDRFILKEESIRRGKAHAINQIIDLFKGQFLVLVNSDAYPEPGAISKLLTAIASDNHVGMMSAAPVVDECTGITGAVLQLMWGVHNQCLLTLNEEDKNNHCCDELIVIRTEALRKLPNDTVNDGAFLAGSAYRAGSTIRFCEAAKVNIDVPRQFRDLLRQRRRIVYGHVQIRRSVGKSPRTIESMLVDNPRLSLSILIRTLAESPKLALVLPIAVIGEVISMTLAICDNLSSTQKHVPWVRFGSRA
jgi:cellulose synthase/poly-beta-1,6-N-acetylglucosamine synthase-like glycosyltransferase